jgi:hypothetical protein
MFLGAEMLCGMFVFRRITTPHVTAAHAQPQMDPGIAHLQALFAAASMWSNVFDLRDVRAGIH